MKIIYMPVKEQLDSDLNKTDRTHYELPSPVSYRRTAAHEMGHALGLDDAYEYKVGNIKINRVSKEIENEELIMKEGKRFDKIHSLEVVMLLYAKSQSYTKSEISWQSYRDYSIYNYKDKDGISYYNAGKKSKVIN